MKKVCLYGASGHCKVIIDILEANGIGIDFIVDDNPNITELLGFPVRRNSGVYDEGIISIGDCALRKKVVESINTTFNPEFWNYGKLLSAMLRHRMPLVYIVKTLGDMRFENDSINSWRTGVIRALKRWIKDGTKLGEKCPECGETLVMENGCRRCPSCGWSACG